MAGPSPVEPRPEDVKTVSFKAMQRARTTLEDFALSYFPYCGLRLPEDLLKYWDVLVWCEASIYQLDEQNEQLAAAGHRQPGRNLLAESVVAAVLASQGLLDDAVASELQQGDIYWQGERELCAAMLAAAAPPAPDSGKDPGAPPAPAGVQVPHDPRGSRDSQVLDVQQQQQPLQPQEQPQPPPQEQLHQQQQQQSEACAGVGLARVIAVHEAKSFDYRVLHLLLRKLARLPPDPGLMAFLRVDEWLVDISDDLVDYEDDVEANSFNLLRAYTHMYGREAPLRLVERISGLEAEHARLLAALPAAQQAHYWRNHARATADSDAQGADRWVFPPLILDEAAFRARLAASTSSDASASAGGNGSDQELEQEQR